MKLVGFIIRIYLVKDLQTVNEIHCFNIYGCITENEGNFSHPGRLNYFAFYKKFVHTEAAYSVRYKTITCFRAWQSVVLPFKHSLFCDIFNSDYK